MFKTGIRKKEGEIITTTPLKSLDVFTDNMNLGIWRDFDISKDYTVGEGDSTQKYEKVTEKSQIHWGQFKLLLTELDFLTRYWDPSKVSNPKLVYVGAATGVHIACLAELFPSFEFHLYDPCDVNKFDPVLAKFPQINQYVQFFTNEDCERWKNRDDVFFVCDIRNTLHKRGERLTVEEENENEEIVWRDMLMQQEWVQIIKPYKAHLKFRLPWSKKYNLDKGDSRPYLDGIVYKQPFAPKTSTETRLVPFDSLTKRDWDYVKYEEIMFYHNVQTRLNVKFRDPLTGSNIMPFQDIGLLADYDSTLAIVIAMGYLKKFNVDTNTDILKKFLIYLINGTDNGKSNLVGRRAGLRSFLNIEDEE